MKNLVKFALMCIAAVSMMTACGNKSSDNNAENTSTTETTEAKTETAKGGDNTIAVKEVTRGYNRNSGEAFIQISFARGSAKGKLMEIRDIDAKTAGFSTNSSFKLLHITAFSNGLSICFEATEDNYGDLQDITYTKPTEPVLKDIDGTPVESFSYKLPYRNLDLYD